VPESRVPRYFTIAEASRLSGIGESVIRSAIARGDLSVFQPCRAKGGIRFISESDLRTWMGLQSASGGASGSEPE